MATKTIRDIDVKGKRVFMRVDFNVPLKDGLVTNDRRIVMALPTIQAVLDTGGRLVLASHLGRPSGKGFEAELSLAPVAERLGELLGKPVGLGPKDVVGDEAVAMTKALGDGEVMLLENVPMPDKAKKSPDKLLTDDQQATHKQFVGELAQLGDAYVNDAFGTCHRKHASMFGVAEAIKARGGPAVAGFLVEKEIKYLHEAVADPARPFVAILGGAKVSDKIKLIRSLLTKVDRILIGGAMAYTLLKSLGHSVGTSLVEEDQVDEMKGLLAEAGEKILLPCDHLATTAFDSEEATTVDCADIGADLMGMDIGAETMAAFGQAIESAKTVVWNGPMGVFERDAYAAGTQAVAEAVAKATDAGAVSVIGGGDSAAAVEQMGLDDRMTHVSTGGGASLTYLEGKPMPPLEVLDQA
ncbi:MAG: phosphoglycerate kinase [Planctomycetota bacterium]|jgi:phosphoglycerate kinase